MRKYKILEKNREIVTKILAMLTNTNMNYCHCRKAMEDFFLFGILESEQFKDVWE